MPPLVFHIKTFGRKLEVHSIMVLRRLHLCLIISVKLNVTLLLYDTSQPTYIYKKLYFKVHQEEYLHVIARNE